MPRIKLKKEVNQGCLKKLCPYLINQSSAASLKEGLDETLTLYRLGPMPYLEQSFRSTNCIESLNSQIGQRIRNVKLWKKWTSWERRRGGWLCI